MSGSAIDFSLHQFVFVFIACALSVVSIALFALWHCVICSAASSLCHQPVLFSLCICAFGCRESIPWLNLCCAFMVAADCLSSLWMQPLAISSTILFAFVCVRSLQIAIVIGLNGCICLPHPPLCKLNTFHVLDQIFLQLSVF